MKEFAVGDKVTFYGNEVIITAVEVDPKYRTKQLRYSFTTVDKNGSEVEFTHIPGYHLHSTVKENWVVGRSHVNVSESVFYELPEGSLLGIVPLNSWKGLDLDGVDPTNTIFVGRISGRKVFVRADGVQMSARSLSEFSTKFALKVLYLAK